MTLICPFERVTLPLCALVIGSLSIRHAQQPEIRFGAHTLGSMTLVSSSSTTVTDACMTTALTDRAAPVWAMPWHLSTRWRKENANLRITPYDLEPP